MAVPRRAVLLSTVVFLLLLYNLVASTFLLLSATSQSEARILLTDDSPSAPSDPGPALWMTMMSPELVPEMEEGTPFSANSSLMMLKDIRLEFFDAKGCPQTEDTQDTTCPSFLECSGEFDNLSFCRNGQWDEDGIEKVVARGAIYRLPQPVIEYRAHLVKAKNMFVSSTGHLFDSRFRYYRGGCSEVERGFVMTPTSRVVKFDEVVVMTNVFSTNFFHQLIELVPAFLQILPLLKTNPYITILVNKEFQAPELLRLVGIDERKVHFHTIKRDHISTFVYGKQVYFPLVHSCHYTTRKLWATIRRNFFTKYGPMIVGAPLPTREPVSNLNIVFIDRGQGNERSLIGQEILLEGIRRIIKPKELISYSQEHFENAVQIFQRAHIILGVHGAGLSNMVFMKPRSAVVEILPEGYTNYCFYNLADTIRLPHFIVKGQGTKFSETTVVPEDVVKILLQAVEMLKALEGDEDPMAGYFDLEA